MGTFREELEKVKNGPPIDFRKPATAAPRTVRKTWGSQSQIVRIAKAVSNEPPAPQGSVVESMDRVIQSYLDANALPTETTPECLARLTAKPGTVAHGALSALYSQRRALKMAEDSPRAMASKPLASSAASISKAQSDLNDAAHAELTKALGKGENISEAEAMLRAMDANPALYSASKAARNGR